MRAKTVKLDPNADSVNFEPTDWQVCPSTFGVMHHLRSGAQYFIDLPGRPFMNENSLIELTDFRARLSFVPNGRKEPSQTEQIEQGRAAIAVFLIQKGLWAPEIEKIPDPPKRCRTFPPAKLTNCGEYECRKPNPVGA